MTPLTLAVLWLAAVQSASRQDSASASPELRYTPQHLHCAAFAERSRARLDTQTGTRQRRETLTRDGLWRMRARPAPVGIAIEAWYDTLALTRGSPEGTLAPDTDGLLGGRFRGTLTSAGTYVAASRPFVPDDVAEVADLGGAMDDLLPRLPPQTLAVGQRWSDSAGLELRRLPDSTAGARRVLRLTLSARAESRQATIRGDTTHLPARQVTVEDGRIDWDPARGLLRRVRHIVVETEVSAGGPLRQPLRSRLVVDATLVRVRGGCGPRAERASS
jgi:hypothetical protein